MFDMVTARKEYEASLLSDQYRIHLNSALIGFDMGYAAAQSAAESALTESAFDAYCLAQGIHSYREVIADVEKMSELRAQFEELQEVFAFDHARVLRLEGELRVAEARGRAAAVEAHSNANDQLRLDVSRLERKLRDAEGRILQARLEALDEVLSAAKSMMGDGGAQ